MNWKGVFMFTLTEAQLCANGLERFLRNEIENRVEAVAKTQNANVRQKSKQRKSKNENTVKTGNVIERIKVILLDCLKEANSSSSSAKFMAVKAEHVGKMVEMMNKKSQLLSMECRKGVFLEKKFINLMLDNEAIMEMEQLNNLGTVLEDFMHML